MNMQERRVAFPGAILKHPSLEGVSLILQPGNACSLMIKVRRGDTNEPMELEMRIDDNLQRLTKFIAALSCRLNDMVESVNANIAVIERSVSVRLD